MKIRFLLPCIALLSLMFLVGCPPTPEQPTAPAPEKETPITEPVSEEPTTEPVPEPPAPPAVPEPTPEPPAPPVIPEPTPEPPTPPAVPEPAPEPPAVVMPAETPEETVVRERVTQLGGSIRKNAEGRIDRVIIGNTSNMTLADAQAIGKLTSIEWFRFVGPTVNDAYVEALGGLVNLQIVDFENTSITDRSLEVLKALPEIHTLNLRRNVGLTDNALKLFAEFPNLHTLRIIYNSFTEEGLFDLDRLEGIRVLDLRGLRVTDTTLAFIADLENLEEIRMRGELVTNEGIEELTRCSKLGIIELQDTSVGPGSAELFKQMPSLRSLQIFRAARYSAQEVAELGILTDLETLELRGVGSSNEALLALKPLTQLRTVDFSELEVDSATIIEVLKSYPKLETVTIFAIPVDDTVASFLATIPTLRSVTLRQTAITDAGLDALTALTDLTFLDIRGNQERLTAQGMLVLGKFKNLQRLIFPATLDNPALRSAILESSPRCVFTPQ